MKTGIVDVGGGLRGVYAAGVFDYCMDTGMQFGVGIGVSAGSANVASYCARQRGRNYPFYTDYPFRKKFVGLRNMIFKRSYLDLDYIYGILSNADGENPLDYNTFVRSPTEFIGVATNAYTGEAKYFDKSSLRQDDYSVLKASSAIPFICHPYEVEMVPYFDGALSDPVPVEKAFTMGCSKVVLILTKPKDIPRSVGQDLRLAKQIEKAYPLAAEKLRTRAERYNAGVESAKQYEDQGKLLIIAPDDTCGVDTLTKDRKALQNFYKKGYEDARRITDFIN